MMGRRNGAAPARVRRRSPRPVLFAPPAAGAPSDPCYVPAATISPALEGTAVMPLDMNDLRERVERDRDPYACADCGAAAWAPSQRGDGKIVMRGGRGNTIARGWRLCAVCARAADPLVGLLRDRGRPHAAELAAAAGMTLAAAGIPRYWQSGTRKAPTLPTDPPQPFRWAHVPAGTLEAVGLAAADAVHARAAAALPAPR